MPGLLDLPLEIRLQIFSYHRNNQPPYWRVVNDHPPVSLVSRQLRQESLLTFYRPYRWPLCISISQEGNMASMDKKMIRYLQAMKENSQLYRIRHVRVVYTLPGVTVFSIRDVDPATHPFDAQCPQRPSFYNTLGDILHQAANLKCVEFACVPLHGDYRHKLSSPACLQLLAMLPSTCDYRLMRGLSDTSNSFVKLFVERIEEKLGNVAECTAADGLFDADASRLVDQRMIHPHIRYAQYLSQRLVPTQTAGQ